MHHLWPCGQVHWCALPPRPPPHAPLLAAHAERVALVSCAVPGGPNKPDQGAIPPVPPGPAHNPNLTPPTIDGITVAEFRQVAHAPSTPPARRTPDARTSPSGRWRRHPTTTSRPHVTGAGAPGSVSTRARARQVLTSFFELLPQAEQQGVVLPPQLANVDQLRVLLDALPDYYQAAPLGRRRTRLASAGTAPHERALAAPRAAAAPSRPRRAPLQHM